MRPGTRLSFCDATLAQSSRLSPPETAFGDAIYGPGRSPGVAIPGSICPSVNQIPLVARSAGTQDLIDRCNDLAATQQNPVLKQVASEEVSTQGRSAVNTTTKTIAGRLAALRRGASGISIQGLGLNPKEPTLPGTLVATLGPFAAVSSSTPTTSTNTPAVQQTGLFANGLFSVGDKIPRATKMVSIFIPTVSSRGLTIGSPPSWSWEELLPINLSIMIWIIPTPWCSMSPPLSVVAVPIHAHTASHSTVPTMS